MGSLVAIRFGFPSAPGPVLAGFIAPHVPQIETPNISITKTSTTNAAAGLVRVRFSPVRLSRCSSTKGAEPGLVRVRLSRSALASPSSSITTTTTTTTNNNNNKHNDNDNHNNNTSGIVCRDPLWLPPLIALLPHELAECPARSQAIPKAREKRTRKMDCQSQAMPKSPEHAMPKARKRSQAMPKDMNSQSVLRGGGIYDLLYDTYSMCITCTSVSCMCPCVPVHAHMHTFDVCMCMHVTNSRYCFSNIDNTYQNYSIIQQLLLL